MKKKLLALSLVAATGLMAQDGTSNGSRSNNMNGPSNGSMMQSNSDCCDPCKPCCVPQPKKCIDCECYSPAFYDLQCDWGMIFSVDFLYWYARETNLSYAAKITSYDIADTFDTLSSTIYGAPASKSVNTSWSPGFRVALGWQSDCDGWDWLLSWTWMQNSKKSSTSASLANGQHLLNQWVNGSLQQGLFASTLGGTGKPLFFDNVSARWKLKQYDVIDLVVGRKYWLSRHMAMRPFAGLRGNWFDTTFTTNSSNSLTVGTELVGISLKDKFANKSWGVGFVVGFEPTWYFSNCFAIYAGADTALTWGQFRTKKSENYLLSAVSTTAAGDIVNLSQGATHKFFQMNGMIDLALGLRWEDTWCCDRYRTALDLGWEHHLQFDTNHRVKSLGNFGVPSTTTVPGTYGYFTYEEATGNLQLGGLVVRLRFEF